MTVIALLAPSLCPIAMRLPPRWAVGPVTLALRAMRCDPPLTGREPRRSVGPVTEAIRAMRMAGTAGETA